MKCPAQEQGVTSGLPQERKGFTCSAHLCSLKFILLRPHVCITNCVACDCFILFLNAGVWRSAQGRGFWFWKYCTVSPVVVDCSGMNMLFTYTYVSNAGRT